VEAMLQVIPNFIAMTSQVLIVLALTFLINLISTLSYSVRIVGIRTGRIAISFALFNILLVISRTANGFQAPLLAKTVENDLANGIYSNITAFRCVIFSSTTWCWANPRKPPLENISFI
jgi:hypothetical protein